MRVCKCVQYSFAQHVFAFDPAKRCLRYWVIIFVVVSLFGLCPVSGVRVTDGTQVRELHNDYFCFERRPVFPIFGS